MLRKRKIRAVLNITDRGRDAASVAPLTETVFFNQRLCRFYPQPRKYEARDATRRVASASLYCPFWHENSPTGGKGRRGADGPLSALFTRSPTSIGTIPVNSRLTFSLERISISSEKYRSDFIYKSNSPSLL